MSKRLLLSLGSLLFCLGLVALSTLHFSHSRSKINRKNFERIREGMTLQEVKDILGGPGRAERPVTWVPIICGDDQAEAIRQEQVLGRVGMYTDFYTNSPEKAPTIGYHGWMSDQGVIEIQIDESGRVRQKSFVAVRPFEKSLWGRLRLWSVILSRKPLSIRSTEASAPGARDVVIFWGPQAPFCLTARTSPIYSGRPVDEALALLVVGWERNTGQPAPGFRHCGPDRQAGHLRNAMWQSTQAAFSFSAAAFTLAESFARAASARPKACWCTSGQTAATPWVYLTEVQAGST